MEHDNHFLADGYERAYSASEPIVRSQVEREYAERLAAASPNERVQIRKEMDAVISKRLDQLAPPDALY